MYLSCNATSTGSNCTSLISMSAIICVLVNPGCTIDNLHLISEFNELVTVFLRKSFLELMYCGGNNTTSSF